MEIDDNEDSIFWWLYQKGPAVALELGLNIGVLGLGLAAFFAVPAIIESVDGWDAIHD